MRKDLLAAIAVSVSSAALVAYASIAMGLSAWLPGTITAFFLPLSVYAVTRNLRKPAASLNTCMFTGRTCQDQDKAAAEGMANSRSHGCVCLHCQAWLNANLPGHEVLTLRRELEATRMHLDGVYKAMRVSHFSSRSVSSHVYQWREALEYIAAREPDEEDKIAQAPARKALRLKPGRVEKDENGNFVWSPGQRNLEERGDIV